MKIDISNFNSINNSKYYYLLLRDHNFKSYKLVFASYVSFRIRHNQVINTNLYIGFIDI